MATTISRRGLLFLPGLSVPARLSGDAEPGYENLEYRRGRLYWSGSNAAAAVGRAGVKADKREGDGATPAGSFPLLSVLYRPDRIPPPASYLPVTPLASNDVWVDDPSDPNYNRLVSLPYRVTTEQMWRDDGLYDALVVIGYNMEPVIPGAGSAIFLHMASPDFAPTAGCVAVAGEVLLGLVPLLGPGSRIQINA